MNALRVRTSKVQHQPNLKSVFQQFPELTEKIENIGPLRWTSKTQTQISDRKNEAKAQYNHNIQKTVDALIKYMDGSEIDIKIGPAACNIDHDLVG